VTGLTHAAGVSPSQASPESIPHVDLYGTPLGAGGDISPVVDLPVQSRWPPRSDPTPEGNDRLVSCLSEVVVQRSHGAATTHSATLTLVDKLITQAVSGAVEKRKSMMSGPIAEAVVVKDRRQTSVVRQAVVRFAISTVVLSLVLMGVMLLLANRIATQEALRGAGSHGYAIGNLIAGQLVNAKVRAQVPGAGKGLTDMMDSRMSDGSVVHIKLWDRNGTVFWSDEKQLMGRRFPLTEDVKQLFGTRQVTAEVSHLTKGENAGERHAGELIEVYAGTHDADRKPMVFEVYFSSDSIRHNQQTIFGKYLLVVAAALLLFQVAVLPLALSLARRVERGLAERSGWMRHALLASDLERRRVAQDLHAGVIQDLAGVSYAMPTLQIWQAGDSAPGSDREVSHRIGEILRRDIAALRSMSTDVYPRDLEGPGFASAVQNLAVSTLEGGVDVEVEMAPDLTVPVDTARLAYRVVREGLRNVAKHSQATAARVEVSLESQRLLVSVSDNGRGPHVTPVPEGHVGLRLLEDAIRDLGGQLTLRSSPSGGTMLEASFPVGLVQP
jgi:signal transduction histidine kinase